MNTNSRVVQNPPNPVTDEWILETSVDMLADWVRRRLAGKDGEWSDRSGEAPSDLIRALLRGRRDEISVKVLFAIDSALETEWPRGQQSCSNASLFAALLDLVLVSRALAPNHASVRIARFLDERLRLRRSSPDDLLDMLLGTRAQLRPPATPDVWERHLTCPNIRIAAAAFQCARFQPDRKLTMHAFERFFEGVAARTQEPIDRDAELVAAQARILAEEMIDRDLELSLRRLMKREGRVAEVAKRAAAIVWPGDNNLSKQVAAFVAPIQEP